MAASPHRLCPPRPRLPRRHLPAPPAAALGPPPPPAQHPSPPQRRPSGAGAPLPECRRAWVHGEGPSGGWLGGHRLGRNVLAYGTHAVLPAATNRKAVWHTLPAACATLAAQIGHPEELASLAAQGASQQRIGKNHLDCSTARRAASSSICSACCASSASTSSARSCASLAS